MTTTTATVMEQAKEGFCSPPRHGSDGKQGKAGQGTGLSASRRAWWYAYANVAITTTSAKDGDDDFRRILVHTQASIQDMSKWNGREMP